MRTHSIADRIRAAVTAFREPTTTDHTVKVNLPEDVVRRVADDLAEDLADAHDDVANRLRHRHRVGEPTEHEYDGPMPQEVAADVSDRVTEAIDQVPDDALVQSVRIDAPNHLRVVYNEAPKKRGSDE